MAFPGTYNFNYYRGDTFEFIIRPKDANGDPYPLDAYDANTGATFTIADRRGPGTVSDPRTSYTGTAIINSVDDIVTCTITPTVGQNLDPSITWFFDVQIDDGGTQIFTLLTGQITVTDDITGAE